MLVHRASVVPQSGVTGGSTAFRIVKSALNPRFGDPRFFTALCGGHLSAARLNLMPAKSEAVLPRQIFLPLFRDSAIGRQLNHFSGVS